MSIQQSLSRLLGMSSVATMITTATARHRLPTPMSPKDGPFPTTIILKYVCMYVLTPIILCILRRGDVGKSDPGCH